MGAFVLRFLSVMCFPHPSKAVHGWERAGVGLPSLLGVTWADPPLEWNSINMSGPMVDFPRTKTHLSSSSPHDGGQMSAAVCRLLRMSMWHVNMSSRIKCCRRIFHLLQCLHAPCVCISGGRIYNGSDQCDEEKEHRSIFIVLSTKCSKGNDKENVSETMEFTWILFIVFPIIST